jgi:hypothetical protein
MKTKADNRVISPAAAFVTAVAALIFMLYMDFNAPKPDTRPGIVDYTADVCEELGVQPALAISLFTVESSLLEKHMVFKKWEAVHRFYVYSIPQISYAMAYSEGFRGEPDALMDYREAIYWAVRHIKTLLYVYDNDICKVIMAYNAGDCVSGNYGYLEKVLKTYRIYFPDFGCEVSYEQN